MLETIEKNVYDFPVYYDLVNGSDWKAEYDFILDCCDRFIDQKVKTIFEPACGTGRLLYRLAKVGFKVSGNDLNPLMVDYCNQRLERYGFPPSAFVGDMADFQLPNQVDLAFNMISSFRHLAKESQAIGHLRSISEALTTGGIYLLGLHLTPTQGEPLTEESWPARRGNLAVISHLKTVKTDLINRQEYVQASYDVYTPTKQFRIEQQTSFRTYTKYQMLQLIKRARQLEIIQTYDFCYDIDDPIKVDEASQDVVFVLRKKKPA